MDDTVRKQVEGIKERSSERLQELSILVLLLQVIFFAAVWLDTAMLTRPFSMYSVYSVLDASSIALGYDIAKSVIGIIFLIGIVWYFWRVRNTPLFHVLILERKEDQGLFMERKEEQGQMDTKRFLTLVLIPVGISIGLAFTVMGYSLYPDHWWSSEHTFWWSFQHTPLSSYPLIAVVCSSVLLYFAYRIKPGQVQRSISSLLFISTMLSIFVVLYAISSHTLEFYLLEVINKTPTQVFLFGVPGNIEFLMNIFLFSTRITFLTCFIVLFYLIYHFSTEDREVYTLVQERQLRGLIEEGMWILPRRVRSGGSHSMSLYLKLSDDFVNRACSGHCSYESGDYLEAELQAIELKVDAEKRRLKICETSPLPITTWNCSFPTPGWHTINLMINVVKQRDNSRDIVFAQQHDVKVDSFLNASIAPAFAIIIPVLIALVQAFLKGH